MEITISIPEDLAKLLEGNTDLSHHILQSFVIDKYRLSELSFGQLTELLDLSVDEANALLKQHRVKPDYNFEDMKQDCQAVELFLKK